MVDVCCWAVQGVCLAQGLCRLHRQAVMLLNGVLYTLARFVLQHMPCCTVCSRGVTETDRRSDTPFEAHGRQAAHKKHSQQPGLAPQPAERLPEPPPRPLGRMA